MIRRPPRSTLFPTDALPISGFPFDCQANDYYLWDFGSNGLDRKSTRLNSSHSSNLVCRLLLEKNIILLFFFFFFNDTATTEIYTLSYRRSSDLRLSV